MINNPAFFFKLFQAGIKPTDIIGDVIDRFVEVFRHHVSEVSERATDIDTAIVFKEFLIVLMMDEDEDIIPVSGIIGKKTERVDDFVASGCKQLHMAEHVTRSVLDAKRAHDKERINKQDDPDYQL